MDDFTQSGSPKAAEVASAVEEIVTLLAPEQIYLYNQRFSAAGATTGFKLCVVGTFVNKEAAEREIYLNIDSDVPFDVLLYTPEEWTQLCRCPDSFAHKICQTGIRIYG